MTNRSFRRFTAALGLFLIAASGVFAQTTVREEVRRTVESIRPADTSKQKYVVEIPSEPVAIPQKIRMDISFKEGHYSFKYVVWRFERAPENDFVEVTRFIYGSSLAFYRKYAGPDSYIVERAEIESNEFDRLLSKAVLFFRSTITKEDICDCGENCGCGGSSSSYSSGDGRVRISLLGEDKGSKLMIAESGTLHPPDLTTRISNGYEDLRADLFYRVFVDAFSQYDRFRRLENNDAEPLAIRMLKEPYEAEYTEYYRLASLVRILGEIGTYRSIGVLTGIESRNQLESDWNKYLSEDAKIAIAKIKTRKQTH